MKAGDVFAEKYILLGEKPLGQGGMGVVWHVHHKILKNKEYAIKILRSDLINEGEGEYILEKFEREAQIGSLIEHECMVTVHDFDCYHGTYYIVMDYIDGKDLRKLCDGHPLPEDKIIRYTMQVLSALHAAHQAGFIHRDIKPANIMIDRKDRAYLTDFGIAKALDTISIGSSRMILTPEYAAPEQIDSKKFGKVCPATDLYSLGITMYHMAIGNPPFTGTTLEVIRQQTEDLPIPPQKLNASLSAGLSAVIMKSVQKRQEDRFPSAIDMAKAIKAIKELIPSPPKPTPPEPITVPNWVNKTMAEVEREASTLGIKIGNKTEGYHSQIASGSVISQNPVPGSKIPQSESVDLVISKGKAPAPPKPIPLQEPSEPVVKPKKPEPGSDPIKPRKRDHRFLGVAITLSVGLIATIIIGASNNWFGIFNGKVEPPVPVVIPPTKYIEVPDVVKKTEKDAREMLGKAGLIPSLKQEPSEKYEAGIVVSQSPAARASVAEGSTVTITVSSGKPIPAGMKVCVNPNCGKLIPVDKKFCRSCGTAQP